MNIEDVLELQRVDADRFVELYVTAAGAIPRFGGAAGDNAWATAAQRLCEFLGFTVAEEPLWAGLHQAVDGLGGAQDELHQVRDILEEFVPAEFELLRRHDLSDDDVARIVHGVRLGLLSFEQPTHDEVEELRGALTVVRDSMCDSDNWASFAAPETRARQKTNAIAAASCGGGLLSTVVNVATAPIAPLFVASVAGGMVSALASIFGWQRRR